jgi:hypothetical protein
MSETKLHYVRWGMCGATYTLHVPNDISEEELKKLSMETVGIKEEQIEKYERNGSFAWFNMPPPRTTDVWALQQSKNRLLKLEVPIGSTWDQLREHAAKKLGIDDIKDAPKYLNSCAGILMLGDPESYDIDEPDFTPDMPSGVK